MPWFEDLHLDGDGSFRDVRFRVQSITSNVGRRTVVHQFPGKDKPFVEDLGRDARRFNVDAYIVGPEYMVGRDELRDAIENVAGPGRLVHPYWGSLDVTVVGQASFRETPNEGGIARIRFAVVEAGDELPITEPDPKEEVEEAADEADEAAAESYESEWSLLGAIADVVQAAINVVDAVASDINKIKGYVNAAMNVVDTIGDAIASVAEGITDLINLPGAIADSFEGIINDVAGAFAGIGDAWDSYFDDDEEAGQVAGTPLTSPTGAAPASGDKRADIGMKTFREMLTVGSDLPDVPLGTGQREIEARNQAAFLRLVRSQMIIATIRAMTNIPFSSLTKAEEVRDEILDALDAEIEDADDTTYGPYVNLRVTFIKYIAQATAELPRVIEFTPATTLPALVIAQQLYGDSTRDEDIIARNSVRNPCEVPGGEVLEVLSDE